MRREVLLSSVIQCDDNPLPTLGLVKGRSKDARLRCSLADSAHRCAVFEYAMDPERAAARGGCRWRGEERSDAYASSLWRAFSRRVQKRSACPFTCSYSSATWATCSK